VQDRNLNQYQDRSAYCWLTTHRSFAGESQIFWTKFKASRSSLKPKTPPKQPPPSWNITRTSSCSTSECRGGGGLAVLEAIKNVDPHPVVIVLTNYPEPAYRASCLAAGADYFLDKSTQFNLVADIVRKVAAGNPAQNQQTPSPKPVRIMVADDSPTMRRMVMAVLQSLPEVTFEQAASGLEVIEKLALAQVNLIVLDLNMPDMHGFEVLQFLRQHQAYKDLPTIVLTTRGDELSKATANSLGASAYLTKPFQPSQLLNCARQLLKLS
jgi:two-component system chemotaxis response regulator CheY